MITPGLVCAKHYDRAGTALPKARVVKMTPSQKWTLLDIVSFEAFFEHSAE